MPASAMKKGKKQTYRPSEITQHPYFVMPPDVIGKAQCPECRKTYEYAWQPSAGINGYYICRNPDCHGRIPFDSLVIPHKQPGLVID